MRVTDVDASWSHAIRAFVERRPATPAPSMWDVVIDLPVVRAADPFYEKPPRGWRAKLRWIWACAVFPWWDPPLVTPAQRWRLEGLRFFRAEGGFDPGQLEAGRVAAREIPFSWAE